jgi:amino acid transporter
MRQH